MEKNLKHLLDISPYKTTSDSPFNIWDSQTPNKDTKFLIIFYSKQSEYWGSLKNINHWALEYIYKMDTSLVPYTIDVNQLDINEQYQNILSKAGAIVCFNLNKRIGEIIKEVRSNKADIPLNIFHTTSNKSWGYQYKYSGLDIISQNDHFFCLCDQDQKILKKLFPQNKVHVFTPRKTNAPVLEKSGEKSLVYSGRISYEKNLHWLIAGLAAYKQRHSSPPPILHLYGEEDFIGRKSFVGQGSYKEFLIKLIERFELNDQIRFYGHKNKDDLFNILRTENYVGIFLSTYDTENFGLAPREILEFGNSLILSSWGAFNDIIKAGKDSNKVQSITPEFTIIGAQFNPFKLADQIELAIKQNSKTHKAFTIVEKYPEIETKSSSFSPLDKAPLLSLQCLTSKAKEQLFFNFYANIKGEKETKDKKTIVPFIEIRNNSVFNLLNGEGIFKSDLVEAQQIELRDLTKNVIKVPQGIYNFLKENSLIF